jgi:hypothetical protein
MQSPASIHAGNVWETAIEAAFCSSEWVAEIFELWFMIIFRGGA